MSRHQIGCIYSDDREICIRIVSDQNCLTFPSIGNSDLDSAGAMDHVTIGQNETIRSEDEARATATSLARWSRSISSSASNRLLYFYVHYRRTNSLGCRNDCARVSVQHVFVRL